MELINSTYNQSGRDVNVTAAHVNDSYFDSSDSFASVSSSVRNVINVFMVPALCVIGFAGNVVNVLVLRRYGYKESNILFLTSMSVVEMTLTWLNAILSLGDILKYIDFTAALRVGAFTAIYFNVPRQIVISINVCHVTTIAVERAIAVCLPFQATRLFSISRIKKCLMFIYIFPSATLFPALFILEHKWIYSPVLNTTLIVPVETQFYKANRVSISTYMNVPGNLFSTFIPVIIIACSLIVILKLFQRKLSFSTKTNSKKVKGQQGMKILLSVCLATIFISIPGISLLKYCQFTNLTSGDLYNLFNDISKLLSQLHASTDFFIYVTMSSKFLKIFKELLGIS
ncbi:thyrotropin-releasing hormone receptor [Biomphalaria glabrata]|nr:thyrotropin-releasing hormone receptor-like [Biomphalaria glabrata]